MTERLVWLDIAKGMGIILVVCGHVALASPAAQAPFVAHNIYLFHMPLFFMLSGMTLKKERLDTFSRRKALTLLLPYGVFLALLGAPALAFSCGSSTSLPALGIDTCAVMALKLLSGGSWLGGMFGTFWFVPCLLLSLLLAQLLVGLGTHAKPLTRWAMITLLVIVAYALPSTVPLSTRPLAIGTVPMATLFVLLGFMLARTPETWSKYGLLATGLVSALVLAWNAPFDIKHGLYGFPLLGVLGAAALSCLVLILAQLTSGVPLLARPLQALGRRTLTIMFLHQFVHLGLRQLGLADDLSLLVLSLVIPLTLHPVIMQAIAVIPAATTPKLSTKSPST